MNQFQGGQPQQQQQREKVTGQVQGRIIYASKDLFKGEHKENLKTKQLEYDEKQQPIWQWTIGLAVPKAAMQDGNGTGLIWRLIWTEFYRLFPNNGQQMIDPRTGFPDPKNTFSMKCKDGDIALDTNGQPLSKREGYAGCYVFNFSTRIQPSFFIPNGMGNVQVTEGIKVGDYVNIFFELTSGTSGLYLNHKYVQLVQAGRAIVSGPSADEIFGGAAPQLNQFIQPVADPMAQAAGAPQGQQFNQPQQGGGLDFNKLSNQQGQPAPQAQQNWNVIPQDHRPAEHQQQGNFHQGGPTSTPIQQQYGGGMPQQQQGQYNPNAGSTGQMPQHTGGAPAQYAGQGQTGNQHIAGPAGQNQSNFNNGQR